MGIYLIIPARNEEKRIGRTLRQYLEHFPDLQVLVVLSMCVDNTLGVVKEVAKQFPGRVSWIESKPVWGNSKGRAVRDGMNYIINHKPTASFIGFIDADNSVSPPEFAKLRQAMKNEGAVIASRYLPDSYLKERESLLRIIASRIFRKLVKWLFRFDWEDTQCGGKIFSYQALKKILPRLKVDDMTFDIEILYYLKKYGWQVKEVPIIWRENVASTISTSPWHFLKTSLQMFISLLVMRVRFWLEN